MIIGLDVGGTHTDVALLRADGLAARAKVPTDASDLYGSVLAALGEILADVAPASVERVVLSTTLTTNAVVKDRLAPVGMLVTGGPGIDPASYRVGTHYQVIQGVIDHRGREIQPVDADEIVAVAEHMHEQGIRHVGVVGKFSNRNAEHERRIAALLSTRFDQVFLGHRISGHLNFPRRIATTYLNAAVHETHRAFFEAVQSALRDKGLTAPVHLMKADGGTMSLAASIEQPAQTILSGPAASIMGALPAAPTEGDALVLDIGGTTTDIALLVDGAPLLEPLGIALGGFKTLIRALQTTSIGVGGDSAVRLRDGSIEIGPDRLGPPLAFGGPGLTPTDALVVLGELDDGDPALALGGIQSIADALGMDATTAAHAILEAACKQILTASRDLVAQVNARPVYTIHEMLEGYQVAPSRVLVLGGPAQAFARHLACQTDMAVSLVPDWGVANAIGAATARTTCELTLTADTDQGIVRLSDSERQWRCDQSYTRTDALAQGREHLRQLAIASGAGEADLEMEVTEDMQFNIVRGFSTAGRNIRVRLQIKPGLIQGVARSRAIEIPGGRSC